MLLCLYLLQTRWDQPDNFTEVYDRVRDTYRPTNAKVVNDALRDLILPGQRYAEIGSGAGELGELAPDFREQIQQTEYGAKVVDYNERLANAQGRKSNVIQADVYDLPFRDGSFDGVIGYSVFDTFQNPDAAIQQMHRVTRPGGRLIHFLDLVASFDPYLDDPTPDKIAYPLFTGDSMTGALQTNREVIMTVLQAIVFDPSLTDQTRVRRINSQAINQLFTVYNKNPRLTMWQLMRNQPEVLIAMGPLIEQLLDKNFIENNWPQLSKKYGSEVYTKTDLNNGFKEAFVKGMMKFYEIDEVSVRSAEMVVPRDPRIHKDTMVNVYHNNVGLQETGVDRTLRPNQVRVKSSLLYFNGRKK